MARIKEEDKPIVEAARVDWSNQCKNFMSGGIPFKDETSKACYERHKRLGY